jgi:cytochrome oxidase Cu insertion factor (SCO1/SenC/PrrC family)
VAVVAALAVALGTIGYGVHRWRTSDRPASIRPSGIPPAVPTNVALLMGLSPVPAKAAPAFTLDDQHGAPLSLSALRGHPVVLEFMDPHCTDICPIVSQEFVDAFHDLGATGRGTVFLGINVNPFHNTTTDMLAYSHEHGLDSIPNWHFVTGSVPALKEVWRDYGISVDAPSPDADVVHSSEVFFIDSQGVERFSASPMDYHTASGTAYLPAADLTRWGQGIAVVVQQLH